MHPVNNRKPENQMHKMLYQKRKGIPVTIQVSEITAGAKYG